MNATVLFTWRHLLGALMRRQLPLFIPRYVQAGRETIVKKKQLQTVHAVISLQQQYIVRHCTRLVMSLLRRSQQWGTFARVWHLFDAKWQDPFKSAPIITKYLRGQYKPIYHPMADCGDHVVVVNSADIALRGDEWVKRVYFHHTGYHGGATWTLAWELHKKDPTMIIKKAVYTSMRGTLQRHYAMCRLHIFENNKIPEDILANIGNQIRQLRPVPERLDRIPTKEVERFPKIVQFPANYTPREEYKKKPTKNCNV